MIVPSCPDPQALVGSWRFNAAAQWAERPELLGRVGSYLLDLKRDGAACGLQVELRKLGNDAKSYPVPRVDRQLVVLAPQPPFTGQFTGRFAPREGAKVAEHEYDSDLHGSFHAQAIAGKERFSGFLKGSRSSSTEAPKLPAEVVAARQPCVSQCGIRCLDAEAVALCRNGCVADPWAQVSCTAPDAGQKISVPPLTTGCSVKAPLAGRWVFRARNRDTKAIRTYTLRLVKGRGH